MSVHDVSEKTGCTVVRGNRQGLQDRRDRDKPQRAVWVTSLSMPPVRGIRVIIAILFPPTVCAQVLSFPICDLFRISSQVSRPQTRCRSMRGAEDRFSSTFPGLLRNDLSDSTVSVTCRVYSRYYTRATRCSPRNKARGITHLIPESTF